MSERIGDLSAREAANVLRGLAIAVAEDFRDLAAHANRGVEAAERLAEQLAVLAGRVQQTVPGRGRRRNRRSETRRLLMRARLLKATRGLTWDQAAEALAAEGWKTPSGKPLTGPRLQTLDAYDRRRP